MILKDTIHELMQYVREGELCSCPIFLRNGNELELAIFTYFATNEDETSILVYGYGQFIKTNGENITVKELDLFQNENEFIVIKTVPIVSVNEHEILYDNYYQELQSIINSLNMGEEIKDIKNLAKAFWSIIPDEATELYRRICPDFLKLMEIK